MCLELNLRVYIHVSITNNFYLTYYKLLDILQMIDYQS